jgi:DUF1680 family protein
MASHDNGLVAAAYSPCEVHTMLGGTAVHITEQTEYPFKGVVRLTIHPASALRFPLRLRIPAWADGTTIQVNGENVAAVTVGGFAKVDRIWKSGDLVEVVFPMKPRLSIGFHDSVSIGRGPLVFSYAIGEDWVKLRTQGMTSDWQVFPTSQWNYALSVNKDMRQEIAVEESPVGDAPFALNNSPVKLKVAARKLPTWLAVDGVADVVPQSPLESKEEEEHITLVPYGAAKLRITAFPRLKA